MHVTVCDHNDSITRRFGLTVSHRAYISLPSKSQQRERAVYALQHTASWPEMHPQRAAISANVRGVSMRWARGAVVLAAERCIWRETAHHRDGR
jgi:hypothetical protein